MAVGGPYLQMRCVIIFEKFRSISSTASCKMRVKFKLELVYFRKALLWQDTRIFNALNNTLIFKKVSATHLYIFLVHDIFSRLKIDTKQIRFAAATLRV